MKVVIDIPDRNYSVTLTKIMLACYGCEVIELPKGHGRLIDADSFYNDLIFPNELFAKSFKEMLDDAATIIPADKESEDKE